MEALYNWKPDYSEVGKENIDKFLEENPKYKPETKFFDLMDMVFEVFAECDPNFKFTA